MEGIVVLAVCTLGFVFITMCVVVSIQDNTNHKLRVINTSLTNENIELTNENIELEKNLEECKQTIKVLNQGCIYDKGPEFCVSSICPGTCGRFKSGYPSKLVDEHFDELTSK